MFSLNAAVEPLLSLFYMFCLNAAIEPLCFEALVLLLERLHKQAGTTKVSRAD